MQEMRKVQSNRYNDVALKIIPGHFVTPNSHINYYMDLSTIKTRQNEARAAAHAMAEAYSASTVVDTILCIDGTEIIGAYLADELTKVGILSKNAHKTMYIVSPERDAAGQIILRENNTMMIKGKNVLIIVDSLTTGRSVLGAYEAVKYYGGEIAGVSAIFSAVSKIHDTPLHALFTTADVIDYRSYKPDNCALCQAGIKVDALANGYGYSRIN